MADPICRWRNTSIKQVSEFTQILPHCPMPKDAARALVEKQWHEWDGGNDFFRTPYQLAAQLGLYYEDDTMFYPRFDHILTIDEARRYIEGWIRRYYVPNPYTGSIRYDGRPIILNSQLYQAALSGESDLDKFFLSRLNIDLGNKDILSNILNNFSDIKVENGRFSIKNEALIGDLTSQNDSGDREAFFDTFNDIQVNKPNIKTENASRQIIYYGAPGTGKSHSVKCETEEWEKKERVVRTTFHPDSDYSTFVGAYKPTTESVQRYDIYNKPMTKDGQPVMEQIITYEFVAQAFLQAYIDAWKNREEPEFLIIEEINRGNCAQIFGDLFQLLDRGDDGYSEYSVRADKDLQKHLAKAFADEVLDDYPKVKSGEVLILPKNLYIRATMNTSDQSLFPIDSAFKRRWDWKYVPIAKGNDNGVELNWQIDIDGKKYDWWTFVKTINKHIFDTTNSEDKQLGFFFCKSKGGIIDAETFVGKVVFYLWNDVFKDFGFAVPIFADKEDETNPKLSFDKFYIANGEVNKDKIKIFLANIGMIPTEEAGEDNEDETADSSSVKIPKYSINGSSEQFTTPQAVRRIIEDYAKRNESVSVNEMIELWNGISERNNLLVDSWQPSPNDNQPFANKRRTKIEWKNGVVWVTNAWTEALFKKFMDNVKQRLGINILRVN